MTRDADHVMHGSVYGGRVAWCRRVWEKKSARRFHECDFHTSKHKIHAKRKSNECMPGQEELTMARLKLKLNR